MCDCRSTNPLYYIKTTTVDTVKEHNMFGCMFNSPIATQRLAASYDSCASVPSSKIEYGIYNSIDAEMAQEALSTGNAQVLYSYVSTSLFLTFHTSLCIQWRSLSASEPSTLRQRMRGTPQVSRRCARVAFFYNSCIHIIIL